MKWISISIIMFLICLSCYSNWGSFTESGSGGLIFPIKNDSIIMLNEEIIINISMINTFRYELSFECNFTFKNMTNNTQTVLMGFPHLPNIWDGPTMDGEKIVDDAIKNIIVKVDGIITEVKTYSNSSFSKELDIPDYILIIATEVTFKPNETKTMQNIFTMDKHIERKGHPMGGTPHQFQIIKLTIFYKLVKHGKKQ
jgi:hypothetical protein